MKKINWIVFLSILIIILAFLLGFSVAKSKNDINQNINTIAIGTNTKDKTKVDINDIREEVFINAKS